MSNESRILEIAAGLQKSVADYLASVTGPDYPDGCEIHGEIRGIIQTKGIPETGSGCRVPLGNGVPESWTK